MASLHYHRPRRDAPRHARDRGYRS